VFAPRAEYKVRDREGAIASPRGPCASQNLQQLVRIDVHGDGHVFGERQFTERFADEPTQAHDGFAADQDVEAKLAL